MNETEKPLSLLKYSVSYITKRVKGRNNRSRVLEKRISTPENNQKLGNDRKKWEIEKWKMAEMIERTG